MTFLPVQINDVTITQEGDVTTTTFPDGFSCSNWPPADDGTFARIAEWLGFSDPIAYCHEHEVAHVLVPRILFGETGYVSWMAAHGRKMSLAAAKAEERLIWICQAAKAGRIETPMGFETVVAELELVMKQSAPTWYKNRSDGCRSASAHVCHSGTIHVCQP